MRSATSWTRWLGVSTAVVALDLASKAWITASFRYGETREITPFFNLVLAHNTGAAFSFLAGQGGWQRWFFTAVAVVISVALVVMLRRHRGSRAVALAFALVLGGALGNLWDRLTLGYVVDFVQLHAAGYSWPAFNVADSAITIGMVLLVLDSLRGTAPTPAPASHEKP
jgi:signal peptidase II